MRIAGIPDTSAEANSSSGNPIGEWSPCCASPVLGTDLLPVGANPRLATAARPALAATSLANQPDWRAGRVAFLVAGEIGYSGIGNLRGDTGRTARLSGLSSKKVIASRDAASKPLVTAAQINLKARPNGCFKALFARHF